MNNRAVLFTGAFPEFFNIDWQDILNKLGNPPVYIAYWDYDWNTKHVKKFASEYQNCKIFPFYYDEEFLNYIDSIIGIKKDHSKNVFRRFVNWYIWQKGLEVIPDDTYVYLLDSKWSDYNENNFDLTELYELDPSKHILTLNWGFDEKSLKLFQQETIAHKSIFTKILGNSTEELIQLLKIAATKSMNYDLQRNWYKQGDHFESEPSLDNYLNLLRTKAEDPSGAFRKLFFPLPNIFYWLVKDKIPIDNINFLHLKVNCYTWLNPQFIIQDRKFVQVKGFNPYDPA